MTFPIDFKLTIPLPEGTPLGVGRYPDKFLEELKRELEKRKADPVEIQDHILTFGVTDWFSSGTSLLASLSGGSVKTMTHEGLAVIEYRLSFDRVFWFATIVTWLGSYLISTGVFGALFLWLLGWSWLYGVNVILTLIRFRMLILKLVH